MTINPLPLTITGTKVYDGDNEVHASTAEAQIQNIISGENILFSGIANSDSEDVGTGVNIGTVGTWTLTDQTHAASNYTFTGGNLNIDITQREIKLPNPDYHIYLTIRGFKNVLFKEGNIDEQWIYGSYVNIKIIQPDHPDENLKIKMDEKLSLIHI